MSSRSVPISRPNDEQVQIPGNGFLLAGTLSRPAQAPARAGCRPSCWSAAAVRPIATSWSFGIPIFGQLAGALADAGFIVVRYDKRGIGQSGGRAEAATLGDYAEDVRAAVKMLADRKDVDPKRIAVDRPQRGRLGRADRGREGEAHRRGRAGRHARHHRRRDGAGAAAAPARPHDADAGREAGEGRSAEADPRGGDHRQGAGAAPAGRAAHGRQRRVPEPADVRSREADRERPAAGADRAGRPRHAGRAA